MKVDLGLNMKEYKMQTVTLTLAAALEAVHRVLSDEEDLSGYNGIELSRKIVGALGFK